MSERKTRVREILPPKAGGSLMQESFNLDTGRRLSGPAYNRASIAFPKGTQTTVSEGHPFKSRKRGQMGDLGGDFFTQKRYVQGKFPDYISKGDFKDYPIHGFSTYTGSILPLDPMLCSFPPSNSSSNGQLEALGATAIARVKPTNHVANASVAIGEILKDGLPHLVGHQTWKDRTLTAKNAGKEFLNFEFGWKPLVADVRSFSTAVRRAQTVLEQFERDAGRQVRRSYTFPLHETRSESVISSGVRGFLRPGDFTLPDPDVSLGSVTVTRTVWQRQWFSGSFTYSLPTGNSTSAKLYRNYLDAGKLLGISLTPETLWNLTPWSWAADWFSNAGDVVSNISDWAVYGLVMHYGYIMEHTVSRDTYTLPVTGYKSAGGPTSPMSFVTETKIRRGANPFGFGVSWNGLSPIQYAILSALGISRR